MLSITYFNVLKQLVRSDLVIFKNTFLDKFIDLTIWVVLTIIVTGYVMPFFGLAHDFGVFQFGGVIAATGLFELYSNVVDLSSDFEGDRIINFSLTLPIPSWLGIIAKAVYYFIIYLILALLMLPIGKVSLWNQISFSQLLNVKLMVALIFQSLFYACFVLWVSSIVTNMTKLGNVWARFIFPMWFMGGFQFSWIALYKAIPALAFINLFNPMIYITEAVRAAILGQDGYINFWLCLFAITVLSAICLFFGLKNLKRRLDYV